MKHILELQYHLLKKYLEEHPELGAGAKREIEQKMALIALEYKFLLDEVVAQEDGGDPPPPPPPPIWP